MDMHIHRIGRTGHAGDKDGTAYTLITQKEARFAGELVHSLIAAGQDVPNELMDLAMKVCFCWLDYFLIQFCSAK
jgi:ATP-dependent RNA helicase DDX42